MAWVFTAVTRAVTAGMSDRPDGHVLLHVGLPWPRRLKTRLFDGGLGRNNAG